MKVKKPQTIWSKLLKIVLIVVASLASSQVATNNPVIDQIVKTAIVESSNVLIDALSSNGKDTAIIITAKPAAETLPAQKTN